MRCRYRSGGPGEAGKRNRPSRPVLVDTTDGWPGRPPKLAWPFAEAEDWEPPRGKRWTRFARAVGE
jgi:hypothetical protein